MQIPRLTGASARIRHITISGSLEGLFGRIKNEFFYYRDWDGVPIGDFIAMLDAYLRYYNEERIKESLGWMSPVQYRKSLGLPA